ncbi:hypothetical protein [Lusitaniella coriacea]|uniref:hypothetical protein n=1 Tax=Lusitaniella coriacea TaxID=1983105 RepID=UPI003CF8A5BE
MSISWTVWAEAKINGQWMHVLSRNRFGSLTTASQDYVLLDLLGGFKHKKVELPWFRCVYRPRGLPKDVSQKIRELQNSPYSSFSWVSLQELLDYDLDQRGYREGYVSEELAVEFSNTPKLFPHRIIDGYRYPYPVNRPQLVRKELFYGTYVEWYETVRDSIGYFYAKYVPLLQSAGEPENVRVIFEVS